MSEIVIGIDLGTTNSCAAYVRDGKVVMVPGRNGEAIVPSMLSLDDKGNAAIGQQAKRRFVTNPRNTIYGAKRLMGRKFGSAEMQDIQKSFFYDIQPDENGEAQIVVDGQKLSITDFSSQILEELREQAQEHLEQKVSKAVVSVPAYFDNLQREAVRAAGAKAGLEVLRVINEPTAAALSYGFGKRANQKILVFDLGGGTFDVTVLQLYDEVYEVIATGGDSFLGGIDFDNIVCGYLLENFKKETGIDLASDRVAMQRVRDAAEKVKIDLSATEKTQVSLPFITVQDGKPVTLQQDIDRSTYVKLVEHLVKQTLRITEKVLLEAKVEKTGIDDIILVGGMTRMPLVQEYVARYFGKKPRRDVHPDEVVAQGAAILAHSLSSGSGSGVVLKDVLPVSIGLGIGQEFRKLINKNTTLPAKLVRSFKTGKDNQENVVLVLYQGESRDVSKNNYLGQVVIDGLTRAPKGQVEVLVAFLVDEQGILSIKAKEKNTDRTITAHFETQTVVQRESYRADVVVGAEGQTAAAPTSEEATAATPAASNPENKGGGFLGWLKRLFGK